MRGLKPGREITDVARAARGAHARRVRARRAREGRLLLSRVLCPLLLRPPRLPPRRVPCASVKPGCTPHGTRGRKAEILGARAAAEQAGVARLARTRTRSENYGQSPPGSHWAVLVERSSPQLNEAARSRTPSPPLTYTCSRHGTSVLTQGSRHSGAEIRGAAAARTEISFLACWRPGANRCAPTQTKALPRRPPALETRLANQTA